MTPADRPRVSVLRAAFALGVAELVLVPLVSYCLSPLPGRCRTPTETLANLAAFPGLQAEAKAQGFTIGLRSRLVNWEYAALHVRRCAWSIRLGAWAIVAAMLLLCWRGRATGRVLVAIWCIGCSWFFASLLLTLPVDKALMHVPALAAGAALASLAAIVLYALTVLWLLPLTRAQRVTAGKCALLFAAVFAVYNVNLRQLGSGDTFAAPYVAVSLVREGNLDVDEFDWVKGKFDSLDPGAYGLARTPAAMVSKYPPMPAVLAAPVFAPFFFVPWLGVPDNEFMFMYVGKLAATILAALSVVGVYLAVRWATGSAAAVAMALLYALGTCTWFVSQALWQHPACLMAIAWALCFLILAERDARWLFAAGFALCLALASRYASVAIVAVLGGFALWRAPRQWWRLALGAAPVAAFQLAYNWRYFGSPFSQSYQGEALSAWTTPLLHGLLGHLIGPSRGIFVYSPFLLFAGVGVVVAWRGRRRFARACHSEPSEASPSACEAPPDGPPHPDHDASRHAPLVLACALAAAAHVLLMSKWSPWHGGLSYGYRMVVEVCPLLTLVLAFGLRTIWRSRVARTVFALAAIWSVTVQLIGAYGYDGSWEMGASRSPRQHTMIRHAQIPFYVERNRWYVLKLKREPVLRLRQTGYHITVDGFIADRSLDYPHILVLEPAKIQLRGNPPPEAIERLKQQGVLKR